MEKPLNISTDGSTLSDGRGQRWKRLEGDELAGDTGVRWGLSNKSLEMRKPVQEEPLNSY